MRAILNQTLSELLKNRVTLSREVKLFTLENVSEEWKLSIATLHRYDSSKLREKTRIYARITRRNMPKVNKTLCQICGEKLETHARCPICTQLEHDYSHHTH